MKGKRPNVEEAAVEDLLDLIARLIARAHLRRGAAAESNAASDTRHTPAPAQDGSSGDDQ